MSMAKAVSESTGQKVKPQDVAAEIVAAIPHNNFVECMKVAGPGFINITIRQDVLQREISKV